MAMKIAILEDDRDRQEAMRRCLGDRFFTYDLQFFERSVAMVEYLKAHLSEVVCVCLDHDLELIPDGNGGLADCGTGREVADFLAVHPPSCPVVIHTTNADAGLGMEMALKDA